MENLLEKHLNAKVVIFDGAMGTELYKRNYFVNVCYENLCLTSPQVIQGRNPNIAFVLRKAEGRVWVDHVRLYEIKASGK